MLFGDHDAGGDGCRQLVMGMLLELLAAGILVVAACW
jgi:hypothetical protein